MMRAALRFRPFPEICLRCHALCPKVRALSPLPGNLTAGSPEPVTQLQPLPGTAPAGRNKKTPEALK